MGKPKVRVGLAIPPKPPLGTNMQVLWAARAMHLDCLLLWDHLQDFFPSALWEPSFTWTARLNASPHEFYDAPTMLGAMAGKAGKVRIGTAVTEPLRRHPVVIAHTFASLAHMTKRAPILGIGAGERENTEPYGLPFDQPVGRLEEALQVIRLCFNARGPIDFAGKHFQLHAARFDLKPPKGRMPEIWVGAVGDRMLRMTGQYGDAWYPVGILTPEEYAAKLAKVQDAARAAGRDPGKILASYQPYMIVAPDRDDARKLMDSRAIRFMSLLMPSALWDAKGIPHPLGPNHRGFVDFLPEAWTRAQLEDAMAAVPINLADDILLVGTPKDVADQLQPYVKAGMRHVVPQALSAAVSRKDAMYSMRALFTIARALR